MTRPTLLGIAVGCSLLVTCAAGCGPGESGSAGNIQAVKGGVGNRCGDGICGPKESCSSCPQDCGQCSACGNGICEAGETSSTCPSDCPAAACGDGFCNGGETCSSCSADCGACPPGCGNGVCDAGEDCIACPGDCPILGGGSCQNDADCFPSACCLDQAYTCVSLDQAPSCGGACNQDCPDLTLSCNQGYCACYNGQCTAVFYSPY
jgi:hypothetical protein